MGWSAAGQDQRQGKKASNSCTLCIMKAIHGNGHSNFASPAACCAATTLRQLAACPPEQVLRLQPLVQVFYSFLMGGKRTDAGLTRLAWRACVLCWLAEQHLQHAALQHSRAEW